jgi:hypothetical protein
MKFNKELREVAVVAVLADKGMVVEADSNDSKDDGFLAYFCFTYIFTLYIHCYIVQCTYSNILQVDNRSSKIVS